MRWTYNRKAGPSRTLHQAQLVHGLRGHDCRVFKLKTDSSESGPWARRSRRASCGARRSGCRRRWRRRGAQGGYAKRNTTPYPSCTLHQAQLVGELRRAQERLQAEVAAQGLALAGLAAERDACRAAAAAADERLKVQSLGSPRACMSLFFQILLQDLGRRPAVHRTCLAERLLRHRRRCRRKAQGATGAVELSSEAFGQDLGTQRPSCSIPLTCCRV